MPIDFSPEDHIVVYPYFTDTLLDLMRADPDFPPTELKKILRYVGEAIQEFHAKGWLHLGMLPHRNLEIRMQDLLHTIRVLGRCETRQHFRQLDL